MGRSSATKQNPRQPSSHQSSPRHGHGHDLPRVHLPRVGLSRGSGKGVTSTVCARSVSAARRVVLLGAPETLPVEPVCQIQTAPSRTQDLWISSLSPPPPVSATSAAWLWEPLGSGVVVAELFQAIMNGMTGASKQAHSQKRTIYNYIYIYTQHLVMKGIYTNQKHVRFSNKPFSFEVASYFDRREVV